MMKNVKLSQLDTDQIIKRIYDQDLDAERVVLVGQDLSIDSDKIAEAVKQGLQGLIVPAGQTSGEIQIINVPVKENVYIPQIEIKTIEIPVIIKEIEYRTIEVPVITEKIVTVEKPIIIKEIEIREIEKERHYPFVMKASAVIQAICVIGLILINLLKK